MDIIREPERVDFVVVHLKLTEAFIALILKAFAQYKVTSEMLSAPYPQSKISKTKKELITKM